MKRFLRLASVLLASVLAVLGSLQAGAALAAGPDGPSGKSNIQHLYLYEKNPADWSVVPGGAWGKLTANLAGPTFDFVFNGHGLNPGGNYTLIYYPDKTGNPWPRTDIECLAAGVANGGGNINLAASVELNTDLPKPSPVDINTGAKIWLVESSAVNCTTKTMSGWNPTEYLFENNLISYDDTQVP